MFEEILQWLKQLGIPESNVLEVQNYLDADLRSKTFKTKVDQVLVEELIPLLKAKQELFLETQE